MKGIIKEFREKFCHEGAWAINDGGGMVQPKEVINWLSQAIDKSREEERNSKKGWIEVAEKLLARQHEGTVGYSVALEMLYELKHLTTK